MKKRVLSLALAAVLCAGMLAVPAGAYDMGKVGERNIVSAGNSHTAAIDDNGSLWMWGTNSSGQLGNGSTADSTAPIKVLDDVFAIDCVYMNTAAIKTDGSLWMWGNNDCGQLGNGTIEDSTVPVKVMDDVVAVSCGDYHIAAIKTDDSLWMWGGNGYGQLGNGTTEGSTVPVKVMDDVAAVSCGSNFTAVVKTDGSLWMWGNNDHGMLGNDGGGNSKSRGGDVIQTVPIKVMDDVVTVSCSTYHIAAIKTDETLWTWGYNISGQLGNGGRGNSTDYGNNPIQTVPIKVLSDVAAVSCGSNFTAAIKIDGSLWMWGYNGYGQLGNGGGGNKKDSGGRMVQTVPVKLLDDAATVSCGSNHTAAIKTDGSLWTWGSNSWDQLGYKGGNNRDDFLGIRQTIPRQVTDIAAPMGVRIYLNGGVGGGTLWTNATGTIQVPTNPTREGYTFGGWYTDAALTVPWNFNDAVVNTLVLYAKWVPVSSTATTTTQSGQKISLNGKAVNVQGYTLKADNGGDVTYVKLRDIAALLDGTSARFNVDWRNGAIYVDTGKKYTTRNGTELKAISGTDGSYEWNTAPVLFDGTTKALEGIVITDGQGGGHTFFKLRDLGSAIGFNVGWSAEKGIYLETE